MHRIEQRIAKYDAYAQGDTSMFIQIVEADLTLSEHREAVLALVDAYSKDTMGRAKSLFLSKPLH